MRKHETRSNSEPCVGFVSLTFLYFKLINLTRFDEPDPKHCLTYIFYFIFTVTTNKKNRTCNQNTATTNSTPTHTKKTHAYIWINRTSFSFLAFQRNNYWCDVALVFALFCWFSCYLFIFFHLLLYNKVRLSLISKINSRMWVFKLFKEKKKHRKRR